MRSLKLIWLGLFVTSAGCLQILGDDEYKPYPDAGSAGAGAGDGGAGGAWGGSGGGGGGGGAGGAGGSGGSPLSCGSGLPACDDKNPCTDDSCDEQTFTCVYTNVDGVPTPGVTQTPGDCKLQFCVNGIDSPVPDDSDLPDDGNNCTDDVCTLGVASNPATAAGTYCEAGKPEVCDGNKACVECVAPENCVGITETECVKRDCVNNKCVLKLLGNETTANMQQPGDCKRNVCNGTDGGYVAIADDTDLPNDNKECTADSCQGGVPKYTNEATTKKCGTNMTSVCDGNGSCVGCNSPADCAGTNDDCKTKTCANSVCGWNYAANNTPLPASFQTAGDCKAVVCDGTGNAVARNDNADTKSDNNQCTKDQCSSGTPVYPNEAITFACNQNGGDICDGNGSCEKSNGKTCAANAECAYNNCVDGICCGTSSCPTCQSCNVSGSLGTCSNVSKGTNDGTCMGATTCSGTGQCKKVDGQSCSQNSDCLNNFCVDGICCQNSCTGTCKACNVAGSLGQCVNAPSGQADTNGSPACNMPSLCDGAGNCKKGPGQTCGAGSECLSTNCIDGACCNVGSCPNCQSCNLNGMGTCSNVASGTDDGTCSGSNTCDGSGNCKKDIGLACPGGNGDCFNAQCVDGVCCATTCNATCKSCNVSGSPGVCSDIPTGMDDTNATMMCSGATVSCKNGDCLKENGQTCTALDGSECLNGNCVDGYCCNSSCTGTCQACNVAGSLGTCSNIPSGSPDNNPTNACDDSGAKKCNGSGACKLVNGQTCVGSIECLSGNCSGGAMKVCQP